MRTSLTCLVVYSKPPAARIADALWCLLRFLRKDFANDNRIGINAIDDAPCHTPFGVRHPQLMATRTDRRHRPASGHRQRYSLLKKSQEESHGSPRLS